MSTLKGLHTTPCISLHDPISMDETAHTGTSTEERIASDDQLEEGRLRLTINYIMPRGGFLHGGGLYIVTFHQLVKGW